MHASDDEWSRDDPLIYRERNFRYWITTNWLARSMRE